MQIQGNAGHNGSLQVDKLSYKEMEKDSEHF